MLHVWRESRKVVTVCFGFFDACPAGECADLHDCTVSCLLQLLSHIALFEELQDLVLRCVTVCRLSRPEEEGSSSSISCSVAIASLGRVARSRATSRKKDHANDMRLILARHVSGSQHAASLLWCGRVRWVHVDRSTVGRLQLELACLVKGI